MDGYVDSWNAANSGLAGFTCCQRSLSDPVSRLSQRVDLVLTLGRALAAQNALLIGATQASKTGSGMWPSDYAGVAVQFSLEPTIRRVNRSGAAAFGVALGGPLLAGTTRSTPCRRE